MEIQSKLSERAIELLMLPEDTPCFLLDIGYVLLIVLYDVRLVQCELSLTI